MFIRVLTGSVLLALAFSLGARAADNGEGSEAAGDRFIVVSNPDFTGTAKSTGTIFPQANPGVLTLGTLAIQARIDFGISAVSTNANGSSNPLTFAWNWGDGTPNGSGAFPNHTYIVAGNYTVTVTTFETIGGVVGQGTPTLTKNGVVSAVSTISTLNITVTDAIKSSKLQTSELFSGHNGDTILLKGVAHLPTGVALSNQPVIVFVGGSVDGATFNLTLNAKGQGTVTSNLNAVFDPVAQKVSTSPASCNAKLVLNYRSRGKGADSVDAPFIFTVSKGNFNPALTAEIPKPTATYLPNRSNTRFTARLTFPNIPVPGNSATTDLTPSQAALLAGQGLLPLPAGVVFQSGINQIYTATLTKGKTR